MGLFIVTFKISPFLLVTCPLLVKSMSPCYHILQNPSVTPKNADFPALTLLDLIFCSFCVVEDSMQVC